MNYSLVVQYLMALHDITYNDLTHLPYLQQFFGVVARDIKILLNLIVY